MEKTSKLKFPYRHLKYNRPYLTFDKHSKIGYHRNNMRQKNLVLNNVIKSTHSYPTILVKILGKLLSNILDFMKYSSTSACILKCQIGSVALQETIYSFRTMMIRYFV